MDAKPSKMSRILSNYTVPAATLEKVTKHVVAPYAQVFRKHTKDYEQKEKKYINIERFKIFLDEEVDVDTLFYETAAVLKNITVSSGVFLYKVDHGRNEISLMAHNIKNPERHQVNIPIGLNKVAAAHVAATKEYLLLDDVPRDTRFSDGLKWVDAKVLAGMDSLINRRIKSNHIIIMLPGYYVTTVSAVALRGVIEVALCMPVIKPDGDCYAVLELYRTYPEVYDTMSLYCVLCCAGWAGAAVHQTEQRVVLQKKNHLNKELRLLLNQYFCDKATLDTMLAEMLTLVKSYMGALRASIFIIDKDNVKCLMADMWDDGWAPHRPTMPKKKHKVNLELLNCPAALVARTGCRLNLRDAFNDARFERDYDPTTGNLVRTLLAAPISDKSSVIGVVQVINKVSGHQFNAGDEEVFDVFLSYCALIVHFAHMHHKMIYHENFNLVYESFVARHLQPCRHNLETLAKDDDYLDLPDDFNSFDFYPAPTAREPEELAALAVHIVSAHLGTQWCARDALVSFVLTTLSCYQRVPYHNALHGFIFTHTMYIMLSENPSKFTFTEQVALLLGGLCHDVDHPGYNNNYLMLCRHPLANMYLTSTLENYHCLIAMQIVRNKGVLSLLPAAQQEEVLAEMRYAILCTDLAVYFQIRGQLTPILADRTFDWENTQHRKMLKGIMMTCCDLSGTCKPFNEAKTIAYNVYEEFYDQGEKERALGYIPLSMMDRNRAAHQPAEQIQFCSVVVLPCLLLLQALLPNVALLADNCRRTQECWHEEMEMRGQRLWRPDDAVHHAARLRSQRAPPPPATPPPPPRPAE